MSGYFKRMGQLARAGAPRHARAGPLTPQAPTLEAISIEVPVTGHMSSTTSADAPTGSAEGLGGQAASTPRSTMLPPRPDSADQTAVVQSSLPAESPKNDSSSIGPPMQGALHRAPPPSGAERIAPARESKSPRNPLGPSFEPKTENVMREGNDVPRNPVTPDTSVRPGPARDEIVAEGTQVLVEELNAPEISPKSQPTEVRTTPLSQPQNPMLSELTTPVPEPAAEALLSPEPRAERKPVESSQRIHADDTPAAPLLAARKSKSDIEVNIGAISLSLDPEPVLHTPTPAPRPASKPRAGGIWSDGRGLARSYLRRV